MIFDAQGRVGGEAKALRLAGDQRPLGGRRARANRDGNGGVGRQGGGGPKSQPAPPPGVLDPPPLPVDGATTKGPAAPIGVGVASGGVAEGTSVEVATGVRVGVGV